MAEISAEEDLQESHKVFASEVVRALNKFYIIPVHLPPIPDEVKYLTDGIYWGIITVAFLLREKNYKVFKALREGLRNENYFHECCMFIPTERTNKFFFNFLKRVSKIYEMAVFCYRNNHDYIETARNCIAQFQDKEYFKIAGSWQRLDRIGNFLTLWSKRLRPVMIQQIHQRFPVLFTTSDEVLETHLDEEQEKFEELNSNDKDSMESLTSDINFPAARDRSFNSALVLLLADEITDMEGLGSIEDEIKSIMRYLKTYLPHKITKYYKELSEDSKNQNIRAESLKPQTSSTGRKTANTKSETVDPKSETPASLFYKQLADEMVAKLTEKLSLKDKCEELGRVEEETKACFQESSDSTKSKFISRTESSKEENKVGYSILEQDLYLSESSADENSERPSADKDCNENKIPSGGDLDQISDKNTSESCSDWAVPTKYTTNSLDDADYIKFLEYDLFVKAENYKYTSFSHGNSDSDDTEPYSAINSLADEGDSGAAQSNIPTSENNDSLTMNIISENKSEVKYDLPVAMSSISSTAASLTTIKDSDSSSETNNEEQLTSTKSVKSSSSEAVEKPNMSNAKSKKRKTKKRKKRGKSKK